MSLFKECTKYVAKSAGVKSLHHVSDLNSAEYFNTLCIVKRKSSFWFWKKDKHIPTQIKLNDILLEKISLDEKNLKTRVLLEKFVETPTFSAKGDVGGKIASELNLDLKGSDDLKVSLDLGNIEKTSVNWEMLEEQLRQVEIDLQHPLFYEIQQHNRANLAVVLETLMTQGEATLKEDADVIVSTDDALPIKKTSISVDVHAKGSVESRTVHSFTLPPKTILAYSCNVFSISEDNKIVLHTSVDTFDENADDSLVMKQKDKRATDKIREEFTSLLNYQKFDLLKNNFKSIIGSVGKDTIQCLHVLLSLAEENIENKTNEKSVALKSIDSTLKLFGEPCKSLLELLGFVLPEDINASDASITLPTTDDNKIFKQCMAFFDFAADIDEGTLKLLKDFETKELKELLDIVGNEMNGTDTLVKDEKTRKLMSDDSKTGAFLKAIGFVEVAMDNVEMISYTDNNRTSLLDVFGVLYVLAN